MLLAALWIGSVACGASSRPPERPEEASVDLAALADAIDPGPQPPLNAAMPPWLREMFGGALDVREVDTGSLAAQVTERLKQLGADGKLTEENLLGLLTAIYALGEVGGNDACALPCLAATEKAYAALDVPMLAADDGFLAQLLELAVQAMQQEGGDPSQLRDVIGFVRAVARAAPAHQRRAAARILRLAPDSAEATDALRHLADQDDRAGDTARALQLRVLVAARTQPAGYEDTIEVVRACVHALRLDCARDWHRRAGALASKPEHHTSLDYQRANLARIERIMAIGAAPRTLELAIERAHLLIEIGRSTAAAEELQRLREAHPADARPVVGLVRASFEKLFMSRRAMALLEEARPLANHDQQFYELALGMFFMRFMGEFLPEIIRDPDAAPQQIAAFLPSLRADVDGLAQFLPARAAVLAIVIDQAQKALPLAKLASDQQAARFAALTAAAMVEARALRKRHPQEPDTHRLALLLARFGGTARGDYGVIDDPVPAGLVDAADVPVMRAGLHASLVIAWETPARLPALRAMIDGLADQPAQQARIDDLRADVHAIEGLLGARADWAAIEQAYRARLAKAEGQARGRVLNNLGVALWRQGKPAEAAAAWDEAIGAHDPISAAKLNRRATEPVGDETLAALRAIADESERASVRAQAVRWHAARSGLTGDALAKAREEAAKVMTDGAMLGITVGGDRGIVLDESFNFGLGYSSAKGLVTNFALTSDIWLVIPAPA